MRDVRLLAAQTIPRLRKTDPHVVFTVPSVLDHQAAAIDLAETA